ARPSIDKGRGIGNAQSDPGNPDVGFSDTAGIGYEADPVPDVVNELAVTTIHVEAAYAVCQSIVLVELVSPDILIAEIDFILRFIRCSSHHGKQQGRRNECNAFFQLYSPS